MEDDHDSADEYGVEPDDDMEPAPRRGGALNPVRLRDFLQLMAGVGVDREFMRRGNPANNEELVQSLWRSGVITNADVKRALLACPRHVFIPEDYQRDAYLDAPMRVEELGFNISAPHIHATALEALDFKLGDSFVDVGCGCGLVSAAAAQLVGPTGQVVAVDIRKSALDLSQRSVAALREEDEEYAAASCTIQWEQHNVFLPAKRHMGRFNKVYVGAACPRERLRDVFQLLHPTDGLLLVPVDSELLLFKRKPDGKLGRRVLSAVRFSELEVPRDVAVVLAVMEEERRATQQVTTPPSTFTQDLTKLPGVVSSKPTTQGAASPSHSPIPSAQAGTKPASSPAAVDDQLVEAAGVQGDVEAQVGLLIGSKNNSKRPQEGEVAGAGALLSGAGKQDAPAQRSSTEGTPKRHKTGPAPDGLPPSYLAACSKEVLGVLGVPDCYIYGSALSEAGPAHVQEGHSGPGDADAATNIWSLPAHKAMLQVRCEHFRALFCSGMRDACDEALAAPEGVSREAVQTMLQYVYQDNSVQDLQLEQVSEVLHVSVFYGCARLSALCEQRLAAVLLAPEEGADEAAAQLLALAEEVGLKQLKQVALQYIVDHFAKVRECDSYKALEAPLVHMVAEAACQQTSKLLKSLQHLAGSSAPATSAEPASDGDDL